MRDRAGTLRRAFALALAAAAAPPARAETLEELYRATRDLSDARTNIAAATADFPPPAGAPLALDPGLDARLRALEAGCAPPATPPFAAPPPTPSAAVAAAIRAITSWQGSIFGSGADALDRLLPPSLPAEEILELKLAVERGDDRLTLHHAVLNDLDSDEARERLYARLGPPARRLRAARGGAPALTIVNTDADDTVFASLWDRGRYRRGEPYPGVRELLAAQAAPRPGRGGFLVVLTARPALAGLASGRTRARFLDIFGLERTDPAHVSLSVAPGEALEILDTLEMGLVKAETLLVQRRLFPEAESVLNGDSGQGDWIAALVLRDLDPEGFPYATIHDVRPWSRRHRDALRAALLRSGRLERIYRRALGLPLAGALADPDEERLDRALARLRDGVEQALRGPSGRLDRDALAERGVFLFRSHAALALDLARAGRISEADADRVVAASARALRLLPRNPFGFDEGEGERLARRLSERLGGATY